MTLGLGARHMLCLTRRGEPAGPFSSCPAVACRGPGLCQLLGACVISGLTFCLCSFVQETLSKLLTNEMITPN